MRITALLGICAIACLGAGCKGGDTHSDVDTPGTSKGAKTSVLESGAAALQSRPPIGAINAYLDGFHFYNGRMQDQMEAHHYCAILSDDLIQCVIYDGNVKDAKLMGVEYIVSDKLFAGLPADEKPLWHSHVHEVKSGQLVAPGIPEAAEHELMEKIVHTYGKTWHTWHTDLNKQLPLGMPQLMMGFTADGQTDSQMVSARDQRLGINTEERKKDRSDIASPAIDPEANGWEHGKTVQIDDPTHSAEHAAQKQQPAAPSQNSRSGR